MAVRDAQDIKGTRVADTATAADVRDYWDRHIHDLEITRHPVGSRGFFDDLDQYHFEKLHHLLRLVDFDGYRGRKVLEVGCGAAVDLARFARGGAETTGIDIAPSAIALARANFEQQGLPGRFEVGDAERLPFADGTFDVAFCVATLHHALDLRAMVGELARVTRRGGVVAGLNEGTRSPRRSGENPEQEHEKELGINEHVHTMWAYLRAFARSGLRPVRLEYAQGAGELAERNIAGKLLRIGRTPATLWALNAYAYSGLSLYARRR
jgi:SAM-dependent methyltransferase